MKYLIIVFVLMSVYSCLKKELQVIEKENECTVEKCLNDTSEYYIVTYHPYGNRESDGFIKNMKKDLIWTVYSEDDEIESKIFYVNDSIHTIIVE